MQGKGVWATGSCEIGRGAYAAIIAHHLPGIALVFPLNIWCSCVELWQRCALALELPGAVTLLLQCYKETLEVQLNKGSPHFLLLLINMLTMILFVWARFFVVTPAMIELVTEGLKIHCRTSYALVGGAFMMTMFNIMAAIPLFAPVLLRARGGNGVEVIGRRRWSLEHTKDTDLLEACLQPRKK